MPEDYHHWIHKTGWIHSLSTSSCISAPLVAVRNHEKPWETMTLSQELCRNAVGIASTAPSSPLLTAPRCPAPSTLGPQPTLSVRKVYNDDKATRTFPYPQYLYIYIYIFKNVFYVYISMTMPSTLSKQVGKSGDLANPSPHIANSMVRPETHCSDRVKRFERGG